MLDILSPGLTLKQGFLRPLGLTVYRLSKDIGVPQTRLSQIIAGKRAISVDTALRLAKYFSLDDSFWLEIQMAYDLKKEKDKIQDELDHIVPFQPRSKGT